MKQLLFAIPLAAGLVIWHGTGSAQTPPANPTPAAGQAPASDSLLPFPIHQQTLDNGLRIVVIPMDSNGLVGYRMVVRTGARDEYEPGRTGFAHFFEHMMFRGTKKYPQDVYGELVTRMGADANAYTSDDVTVYLLNIAAEDLEQVMELESDRFKNLHYAQQVFQTEAGAVYGEYRKNRTSPFFTIFEALRKAAFTRHTYGHTAMGYEKDIKEMPKMFDYSKSFFSRYYRPDNSILVVAGDVEPDKVFTLARKYYGDWKKGYVPPKVQAEPEQVKENRIDVAYEGRTLPIVIVAYKGGAYNPTDRVYAASHVLAQLAFGQTSDIYRRLVLEEQIVQNLDASPADSRDPDLWNVMAVVKDPGNVDAVIQAIDATVKRYRDQPPDAKQLAEIKSNIRYSFLMGLSSPGEVAGQIAHRAGVAGSVEGIEQFYKTLAEVTPEDVQAAAQKYLVQNRRTIAVLREKQ